MHSMLIYISSTLLALRRRVITTWPRKPGTLATTAQCGECLGTPSPRPGHRVGEVCRDRPDRARRAGSCERWESCKRQLAVQLAVSFSCILIAADV